MGDEKDRFNEIIAKCWTDPAFKKRFIAEPKKVLAEFGTILPDGFNLKVVENTEDTMHLVLPPAPKRTNELSDGELDSVSGGAGTTVKPAVMTSPTITKLNTFQLATSGSQYTCTMGKECCV